MDANKLVVDEHSGLIVHCAKVQHDVLAVPARWDAEAALVQQVHIGAICPHQACKAEPSGQLQSRFKVAQVDVKRAQSQYGQLNVAYCHAPVSINMRNDPAGIGDIPG